MPVRATYNIYVDWNDDGDFGDSNEEITSDVQEIQISYGRDYASQLSGRSTASKCTLKLRDTTGKYSNFNTSSPIYGDIVPGRAMKVTMTWGAVTQTLWKGFLDAITTKPSKSRFNNVTLSGIGPLGYISQRNVNVPMQTSILTGAAVEDILDEISWPAGDRDLDTGQVTMDRWWTGGKISALQAIRDIEDTEVGFLRETRDGKIAFEDKHHRLNAPHTAVQTTFTDANGANIVYSDLTPQDPLKEIYNIIEAEVTSYAVESTAILSSISETPFIEAGDSITIWARFPNPASATDSVAVDNWVTPVATTDYTFNAQSDGGGADLTADLSFSVSKFDNAMKMVITNTGATDGYITKLEPRGEAVSANDPIIVKAEDSSSKSTYGERTYPLPARFLPNIAEAQDHVDFLLSVYKKPIPVLSMRYNANRNSSLMQQARDLDVSDRVHITATGNTLLGIDADFFIEAVRHKIFDSGKQHIVTYDCSSAADFSGFWVIGVSLIGLDTRVA